MVVPRRIELLSSASQAGALSAELWHYELVRAEGIEPPSHTLTACCFTAQPHPIKLGSLRRLRPCTSFDTALTVRRVCSFRQKGMKLDHALGIEPRRSLRRAFAHGTKTHCPTIRRCVNNLAPGDGLEPPLHFRALIQSQVPYQLGDPGMFGSPSRNRTLSSRHVIPALSH